MANDKRPIKRRKTNEPIQRDKGKGKEKMRTITENLQRQDV